MFLEEGRYFIGFFKGLPYGNCNEQFDDYKRDNCVLERSIVLSHLESLNVAYTSEPTYDFFTGERILAGLCDDGKYTFTTDFIWYYRQCKVDIPKEYEDYLIDEIHVI